MILFIFIGPIPYFPITPHISMTFIAVIAGGIGITFINVSTLSRAKEAAEKHGYPSDIQTNTVLSGKSILDAIGPDDKSVIFRCMGN